MINRTMSLQIWIIALCAGFIGSVVAERWTLVQPVSAQVPSQSVKVIEAQELRIMDKDGKVRIVLSTTPDGSAAVMVIGKSSRSWIGIGLEGDDRPYVALGDKNAQARASLGIREDSSLGLVFKDQAGKDRVTLRVGNEGAPFLMLSGGDERASAALDTKDGLILWGTEGKSVANISSQKKGMVIHFADSEGQRGTFAGNVQDGKPTLALGDTSGKLVWKAP